MRRKHAEITDRQTIENMLNRATIGRMGTIDRDGYPYITPVNFVYHQGAIYFHSAPEGEKLDNIARNPHVCFEVDIPLSYLDSAVDPEGRPCMMHQFFHCVIIRGEASVLPDGPMKTEALNALSFKGEPDAHMQPVTADLPKYHMCKVVQIKPVSISMKSDLGQNRTAEGKLTIARHLAKRNRPGDDETVTTMGYDPEALRKDQA